MQKLGQFQLLGFFSAFEKTFWHFFGGGGPKAGFWALCRREKHKILNSVRRNVYFPGSPWRTAALLLKLPYPKSNCAYVNTFHPIHCLHTATIVDGKACLSAGKNLDNGALFWTVCSHSLTISTGTEPELWIAVCSKLRMVDGRYDVAA